MGIKYNSTLQFKLVDLCENLLNRPYTNEPTRNSIKFVFIHFEITWAVTLKIPKFREKNYQTIFTLSCSCGILKKKIITQLSFLIV